MIKKRTNCKSEKDPWGQNWPLPSGPHVRHASFLLVFAVEIPTPSATSYNKHTKHAVPLSPPTASMPTLREIRTPAPPTTIVNDGLSTAIESLKNLATENFHCSNCQEKCTGPHVVPECLHRFCGDCSTKYVNVFRKNCPACRAAVASAPLLSQEIMFDVMVSTHTERTYTVSSHTNEMNDSRCRARLIDS